MGRNLIVGNNEIVQNKEITNARKIAKLVCLVIKVTFLVGGLIFFTYAIVGAMLIQVPLGSEASSFNRIGSEPQFIVLVDTINSTASEKLFLQVFSYIFKVFTLIFLGIFLSPFIVLLIDFVQDFKKDLLNFTAVKNKTVKESTNQTYIFKPHRYKLLKITGFLFSEKTQQEVFKPTMSDWDSELFEAENQKKNWKARWINVRYTYAFLVGLWQKSLFGDLLEYIRKFAK